ncbi:acyl-CoA dehydrogenase family protein [Pseudoxanthomonas sacheonensis]|uniref:Alkylation response protein AidB-like acyl-CoA dehydrogenase n=1 Tax=Pseudoxanthomonas sacheonensis TaxID=443615 RepID=A0ABU1RR02_9GAMM|nr:acyl-CoA dehydrogenase family protein [Pseudoxanthomonas sacheonensis]MDR6840544.1 alkylation response protein AidB-like acyl-CoA dehydrogenase [Pseudoxanthomonas sacheonensis]
MDLDFNLEEQAFRDEVRQFLAAELPADIRDRMSRDDASQIRDDIVRWQKILHAKGWGAPAWPVEFGGTGWSKTQQYLFETECALADAPAQLAFGIKMVAPVIMRYGSAEQQQQFLPRILAAEDWWCQGYSETGSGSDLASLKMKAERDGDDYVLNGRKVWNTLGQFADWIFCLVRTDPAAKPQKGISFLLIDMKTPGISVRPTRLLDGTFEVNEIWFDEVRVPASNRVGEENQGWTYAKFLLGHERTNIAGIGACKRELQRLKQDAAKVEKGGRSLLEDPLFGSKVAQVEIELTALEVTNMRVIFAEAANHAPGPEASMLKIRGTEIMQRISELQVELLGPGALAYRPDDDASRATAAYLNLRKLSIFGGSNEIQRNIIAHMILGL